MVCFQPAVFLCLCLNTIGVSSSKPDLNIKAKMKQKLSELPAEEPASLKISLEWHQTAVHSSLEHRCRRRERQLINGTQLQLRWFIKVDNLQTLVSLLLTASCQRCESQHVFHMLIGLWDSRVTFHVILYRRPKQRATSSTCLADITQFLRKGISVTLTSWKNWATGPSNLD